MLPFQAEVENMTIEERRLNEQTRLSSASNTIFKVLFCFTIMLILCYIGLFQRNARKVDRPVWRWKQSKVPHSLVYLVLFVTLGYQPIYLLTFPSLFLPLISSKRWLLVTEDDIKSLPCLQVTSEQMLFSFHSFVM